MSILKKGSFSKRLLSAAVATTLITGCFAGLNLKSPDKVYAANLEALSDAVYNSDKPTRSLADILKGVNPMDRQFVFASSDIEKGTSVKNDKLVDETGAAVNDYAELYSDEGELSADYTKRDKTASRGSSQNPYVVLEVVPNPSSAALGFGIDGYNPVDFNSNGFKFVDTTQLPGAGFVSSFDIKYKDLDKATERFTFSPTDAKVWSDVDGDAVDTGVVAKSYGYYYQPYAVEMIGDVLYATDGKGNKIEQSSDNKLYNGGGSSKTVKAEGADAVTNFTRGDYIWVSIDLYQLYDVAGDVSLTDTFNAADSKTYDKYLAYACEHDVASDFNYGDDKTELGALYKYTKYYTIRELPVYKVKFTTSKRYHSFRSTNIFVKYAVGESYTNTTDDDKTRIENNANLESAIKMVDAFHCVCITVTPEELNTNLSLLNAADFISFNSKFNGNKDYAAGNTWYEIRNANMFDYDSLLFPNRAYYDVKQKGGNPDNDGFTADNDISWKVVKRIIERHASEDEVPVTFQAVGYVNAFNGATTKPSIKIGEENYSYGNILNGTNGVETNFYKMVVAMNSMSGENLLNIWFKDRIKEVVNTNEKILYVKKDDTSARSDKKKVYVGYNTTGVILQDELVAKTPEAGEGSATYIVKATGKKIENKNWNYLSLVPFHKLVDSLFNDKNELDVLVMALLNKYDMYMTNNLLNGSATTLFKSTNYGDNASNVQSVRDRVFITYGDNDNFTQNFSNVRITNANSKTTEVYDWFGESTDKSKEKVGDLKTVDTTLTSETIFYYLINSKRKKGYAAIDELSVLEIQPTKKFLTETDWKEKVADYLGNYLSSSCTVTIDRVTTSELKTYDINYISNYDMVYVGAKGAYSADNDITPENLIAIADYAAHRPVIISDDFYKLKGAGTKWTDAYEVNIAKAPAGAANINKLLTAEKAATGKDNLYTTDFMNSADESSINTYLYCDLNLSGAYGIFHYNTLFRDLFTKSKPARVNIDTTKGSNGVKITDSQITVYFTNKQTDSNGYDGMIFVDMNLNGVYDEGYSNDTFDNVTRLTSAVTGDSITASKIKALIKAKVKSIPWRVQILDKNGIVVDSIQGIAVHDTNESPVKVLEIKAASGTTMGSYNDSGAGKLNATDLFTNKPAGYDFTYTVISANSLPDEIKKEDYDVVVVGIGGTALSDADGKILEKVNKFKDAGGAVVVGAGALNVEGFRKYVGISNDTITAKSFDQVTMSLSTDKIQYTATGTTTVKNGYSVGKTYQYQNNNVTEFPYNLEEKDANAVLAASTTNNYKMGPFVSTKYSMYFSATKGYSNTNRGSVDVNEYEDQYYTFGYCDDLGKVTYYCGISETSDVAQKIFINTLVGAYQSTLGNLAIEVDNTNKFDAGDKTYLYYTVDPTDPDDSIVGAVDETSVNMTDDIYTKVVSGVTKNYKRVYFEITTLDSGSASAPNTYMTKLYGYQSGKFISESTTDAKTLLTTVEGEAFDVKVYKKGATSMEPKAVGDKATLKTSPQLAGSCYQLYTDTIYYVDLDLADPTNVANGLNPYVGIVSLVANNAGDVSSSYTKDSCYAYKDVIVLATSLFSLD